MLVVITKTAYVQGGLRDKIKMEVIMESFEERLKQVQKPRLNMNPQNIRCPFIACYGRLKNVGINEWKCKNCWTTWHIRFLSQPNKKESTPQVKEVKPLSQIEEVV